MSRMFRVLAFWTLAIALMAIWGGLSSMAWLFLAQTVLFLMISYFKLTEKQLMYIFGGYMVLFFVLFTIYSFFIFEIPAPGTGGH